MLKIRKSTNVNKELYKANKELVREEMDEFEDYVDSLVEEMN